MAEINKVAEALFEKIRDRFDDVSLGDDKAKATQNPEDARFFNFDYDVDGKTHGNITISLIDEHALKVYFSTNISSKLDEEEKTKWYGFLRELREFAKRNMLSFEPRDITRNTLKHRDLAHVSKADSTFDKSDLALGESKMYGTANRSYQKFGPARIVVQHSKPVVDEAHGARARNINAIFVENDQGERFKLPFKNMIGARAMARHISAGGNTHDDIGKHITEMVTEYNKLRPFLRSVRTRTFEDTETKEMCEAAMEYHNTLHRQLNQLKGKRGYSAFKESFVADNTLMDDVDVDSLKDRFVRQVYDDRIDEALPIVNKAHKMKTSSKLAAQFESWANNIVEGTFESEEATALNELFKEPLIVGVDGINATAAIQGLIPVGDQLVNALTELAEQDPEADARQTIADWIEGQEPELYMELFGDEYPNFENGVEEGINWPKEVPTDSGFPGEQGYDDDELENDPHPYNIPPGHDEDELDESTDDEYDRRLAARMRAKGYSDEEQSQMGKLGAAPNSANEYDRRLAARMRAKGYSDDEQSQMGKLGESRVIYGDESWFIVSKNGDSVYNDERFEFKGDAYDYLESMKDSQEYYVGFGKVDSEGQFWRSGWEPMDDRGTGSYDESIDESNEEPNDKLQSYVGKQVYVKTAGASGKVIQVSPTHRNSLVIALDNGQQTVAHFTDVSDEKPGTIRHVLDKFNALTGGNPSKSPARTQRAAPSTQSRDFAESDDNEPDYCPACDGTGEGQYDGAKCSRCGGSGVLKNKPDDGPEYEKFNESLALLKRYIQHKR